MLVLFSSGVGYKRPIDLYPVCTDWLSCKLYFIWNPPTYLFVTSSHLVILALLVIRQYVGLSELHTPNWHTTSRDR
jgi:hypothetical protein